MATACLLEWSRVNADQFDNLFEMLGLAEKFNTGSAAYGASEDGGKLIVITVWESQAALDNFLCSCLSQAVNYSALQYPFIKQWNLNGNPDQVGTSLRLNWKEKHEIQFISESHKN